jgi:multidrug efflux pump subunit AcrA (membrane-fusion protein)
MPLAVLGLAIVVAGGGYWYFKERGMPAASTSATVGPQAVPVTVAKPVVKEITEWDEFTGRFDAVDMVDVRARVSGYLASIHFTEGSMVKKATCSSSSTSGRSRSRWRTPRPRSPRPKRGSPSPKRS